MISFEQKLTTAAEALGLVRRGDRVFVADKSGVLAALALTDGQVVWRFEAGDAFAASPAIAAGRLVIGTEMGVLYCLAGADQVRRPEPPVK